MSDYPLPHLGRAAADRFTILRPFECDMRSVVNRQNIHEAKAGLVLGATDLIGSGGYRIVNEITLGDPAEALPTNRAGDIAISHDTGRIYLCGPSGHELMPETLVVNQGLSAEALDPERIYTVTFATRAITQLAGILVEETGGEPLVVLQALRDGRRFTMRARDINRVVIQALEAAGSINHLIETRHREAWMSLRLTDVVTGLTLS